MPAPKPASVSRSTRPSTRSSCQYVAIYTTDERVLVTAETAVAFYISRFLDRTIVGLFCPMCNTPHLDSDWYAVKPHRVHLCHGCNRLFRQEARRVSNPLEMVRHQLGVADAPAEPVRATGDLDIRQADYPGGLQIWASNPALIWTSPRREQEGIHRAWLEAARRHAEA